MDCIKCNPGAKIQMVQKVLIFQSTWPHFSCKTACVILHVNVIYPSKF